MKIQLKNKENTCFILTRIFNIRNGKHVSQFPVFIDNLALFIRYNFLNFYKKDCTRSIRAALYCGALQHRASANTTCLQRTIIPRKIHVLLISQMQAIVKKAWRKRHKALRYSRKEMAKCTVKDFPLPATSSEWTMYQILNETTI